MIGIKDFDMPHNCKQCSFCDWGGICSACGEIVGGETYTDVERYEDCPLVEIKGG